MTIDEENFERELNKLLAKYNRPEVNREVIMARMISTTTLALVLEDRDKQKFDYYNKM